MEAKTLEIRGVKWNLMFSTTSQKSFVGVLILNNRLNIFYHLSEN